MCGIPVVEVTEDEERAGDDGDNEDDGDDGSGGEGSGDEGEGEDGGEEGDNGGEGEGGGEGEDGGEGEGDGGGEGGGEGEGCRDGVEVIDGAATGTFNSVAVDDEGLLHVAYSQVSGGVIYARQHAGGAWTFEVVQALPVGSHPAIAVGAGPDPEVHVVYPGPSGSIDHAVRDPETQEWSVPDSAVAGATSARVRNLEIDDDGGLHLLYEASLPFVGVVSLYVHKPAGAQWGNVEQVAVLAQPGVFYFGEESMALDDDGVPHVAYQDDLDGNRDDLGYAVRAASGWATEIVTDVGFVGGHNAIAVDDEGTVHIAYTDLAAFGLQHAHRAATADAWTLQTLDTTDNPDGVALATGADGVVRAAYRTLDFCRLRAAAFNGTTWDAELVDDDHCALDELSLAVDGDSVAHVVFHGSDGDDLLQATVCP